MPENSSKVPTVLIMFSDDISKELHHSTVNMHQPSKVSIHTLLPLFIVLSQTSVIQSRSLKNSWGSLGAWHSTDDSILLNITSPPFGFLVHLENTTHYCQPRFQTKQIKSSRLGHNGSLWSVIISAVYLPTEQFVTKQVGKWITAGYSSAPLQSTIKSVI